MIKNFTLEKRHLRNGRLTPQDFSDYAGYAVPVYNHNDFPHWRPFITEDKLPKTQHDERAKAIYSALARSGVSDSSGGPFSMKSANVAADWQYSLVYVEDKKLPPPADPYRHFDKIIKSGIRAGIEVADNPFGKSFSRKSSASRDYKVIPGVLSEKLSISSASMHSAAFIISKTEENPHSYWSNATCIPHDRLKNFPRDGMYGLSDDLHEMRHLRQVDLNAASYIPGFYLEADADIFKHYILQNAGVGRDTNIADRHRRYLNMLVMLPQYKIAPTLEAIHANEYPADFYSISRAVTEIRTRIVMESLGEPHANVSSKQFQSLIGAMSQHPGYTSKRLNWLRQAAAFGLRQIPSSSKVEERFGQKIAELNCLYFYWKQDNLIQRPEIGYSLLKTLLVNGVFTNRLSNAIANNIIAAAEYFNPALTREDAAHKKTSLPTRSIKSMIAVGETNFVALLDF